MREFNLPKIETKPVEIEVASSAEEKFLALCVADSFLVVSTKKPVVLRAPTNIFKTPIDFTQKGEKRVQANEVELDHFESG
jgi:hypothetical protein